MQRVNFTYLAASAVLLAIAGIAGNQAFGMQFYSSLGPGAGFFPAILSVLLAILALTLMAQSLLRPASLPAEVFRDTTRIGVLKILAITAALLLVSILFESIGFPILIVCFFFFVFVTLSGKGPLFSAVISILLGIAYFTVFSELLRVHLPLGLLGS